MRNLACISHIAKASQPAPHLCEKPVKIYEETKISNKTTIALLFNICKKSVLNNLKKSVPLKIIKQTGHRVITDKKIISFIPVITLIKYTKAMREITEKKEIISPDNLPDAKSSFLFNIENKASVAAKIFIRSMLTAINLFPQ